MLQYDTEKQPVFTCLRTKISMARQLNDVHAHQCFNITRRTVSKHHDNT